MAFAVTPKSVGLMLAATVAAGWFEAVTTRDPLPVAAQQQTSRGQGDRSANRMPADRVVPNTDRLRQWLDAPPSPARGRNPFVYGSRTQAPAAARDVEAAPESAPAMPVEAAPPVFKLSGIAANAEGGVVTLTAIIIDNGTMVLVKAGDKLSNGYSVVEVTEGSVTLQDAAGVTQTIRLP